jgi:hypothetical protein
MTAATLFRLSGLALMLSVPPWIVGMIIHPRTAELADVAGSSQSLSHAILAAAVALVLLGLPGLYAHHAGRSGVLGLSGVVLMMLFAAYLVYMLLYEAGPVAALSTDPAAERLFAAGGVVKQGDLRRLGQPLSLASIVYGSALLRAGHYSRWAGWLVIAFVPVFFALSGLFAAVSPATQETLLDLRIVNVVVGGSQLLMHLGLAIAGWQLWRTVGPAPRPSRQSAR